MDAFLPLLGVLGVLYLVAIGVVLLIEWIYKRLTHRQQRPSVRRAALIALLPEALMLVVLAVPMYEKSGSPVSTEIVH